jgi:class 3 adenylate cyclase
LPGLLFAQATVADSLLALLAKTKEDTNKVNLLNEIAWELKTDDAKAAIARLDAAILLARKLHFRKGEGNALNYRGVIEDLHGNSEAATDFFHKALKIRELLNDRKGMASILNNIGNVAESRGDYMTALDNYQKALSIRESLQDTVRMARAWYNIGIVLERMGNYPEALNYVFLYLEHSEQVGNKEGVAKAWNVIGNIKVEVDRIEEAMQAYQKSLALHRELEDDWAIVAVLNNIANLKDTQGETLMDAGNLADSVLLLFDQAIKIHEEALTIRLRLEDPAGQAESLNNIGYVLKNKGSFFKKIEQERDATIAWAAAENYFYKSLSVKEIKDDKANQIRAYNGLGDVRRRQKRYKEALDFTTRYYKLAVQSKDQKYEQNGLKDLARIHFALGNYKVAYEYRERYDELRYQRFNEERIKNEERREAVYSDRMKQLQIRRQEQELQLQDVQLKNAAIVRNSLLGGALLLLLLAVLMFNRNKIIRREKQRSDNLLLNILPAQTAEELKKEGKTKARYYENATILFTDFQSFTQISEELSPELLVAELDECFKAFDEIVTHYGIEKIKTIGDAYLCVAGAPVPSPTHAESAVRAGLAMQTFMETFRERQRKNGVREFYCRIGIHSGPLVAGVVGQKKFAYDIWGDAVNIAARMEQSSEAGKVNLSQSTYLLVKDHFHCTHRGKVAAKNKGALDMYFVEGEKV